MAQSQDTGIEARWNLVRSPKFHQLAGSIIHGKTPDDVSIVRITHMRTAHYAVYKATDTGGTSWVVRIGALDPENSRRPANNTGFLNTSTFQPVGQAREAGIAEAFSYFGAKVCVPALYAEEDGYDIIWTPFLEETGVPLTANQWIDLLSGLQEYGGDHEFETFTNRVKSFDRLDGFPTARANELRRLYDERLEELFSTASTWSVIHGDAHAGNVINTTAGPYLFDFDTVCWAPSVWDYTHLLTRAGTNGNTGYTSAELRNLLPFSDEEIDAAVDLRQVARVIAAEYNQLKKEAVLKP